MKVAQKEKERIITYCEKVLKEDELTAEKKCIELIRKLQSAKKHKMRQLEGAEEEGEYDIVEEEENLLKNVDLLEDNLMEIEMLLQDALQKATGETYFDKVKAINL